MIPKIQLDLYDEALNYPCDNIQDFHKIMENFVDKDTHEVSVSNSIILNRIINLHLKQIIANIRNQDRVLWFLEQINQYSIQFINNLDPTDPLGDIAIEECRQVFNLTFHLIQVEHGFMDH